MNTQKVLIALGVILAVALGVTFPRGNSVVQQVATQFGAAPGPDNNYPCTSQDGVQICTKSIPFIQASTTVCALQVTATSSLEFFSANFVVSSTSATKLTIATSTGPTSTTSPILTGNMAANQSEAFAWSYASTSNSTIVKPGTWIVAGLSGGTGTFSPTGSCKVIQRSL